MPTRAFKERLEQAKGSGRTAALTEMEAQAKKRGFVSVEAMFAHLDKKVPAGGGTGDDDEPGDGEGDTRHARGAGGAGKDGKGKDGKGGAGGGADRRNERDRELEREKTARAEAEKRAAREERLRKDEKRQREALEVRSQLERVAMRVGVRDTDYAITLYKRHIEDLDEKALETLDEGKFFEGLKESHTFLFGEVKAPITTGTGAGAGREGKGAGAGAGAGGAGAGGGAGEEDVRTMSTEKFQAHLKKKGINPLAVPHKSTVA